MNKGKIGVLTSGGDAPGMNACIRAVVRSALYYGFSVTGIERGYAGLLEGAARNMDMRSVSDTVQRGGTVLKTARSEEFPTAAGQKKAARSLKELGLCALVVIGGDGSFRGAKLLSDNTGLPVVGIPGTIDNDLPYTDFTLGFDTAVNTALYALNNIRDTMTSHDRICFVEVMGRNSGDIALYAGLAGGAEIIITPEDRQSADAVCKTVEENIKKGKTSNIIVVAEGAGSAESLCKAVCGRGLSARYAVLGHIQRGGSPSMADRVLAARFGVRAAELIDKGLKGARLIGVRGGVIIDVDIDGGLSAPPRDDSALYKIAEILGK